MSSEMSNEKKEDKKKTKQEKKLEKKNLKKSKESLNISTSPSKSPRFFRKNKSTSNIPGDAGQVILYCFIIFPPRHFCCRIYQL